MKLLVDASATLAYLLNEDQASPVAKLLSEADEGAIMAPFLWRLEIANGLLSAVRRQRINFEFARSLASLADRMNVTIRDNAWPLSIAQSLSAAMTVGLTPYDQIYLGLAVSEDATLVSLDGDLRDAAKRAGLTVRP